MTTTHKTRKQTCEQAARYYLDTITNALETKRSAERDGQADLVSECNRRIAYAREAINAIALIVDSGFSVVDAFDAVGIPTPDRWH